MDVRAPAKLGTDFQVLLPFHKKKGNQKVTKGNRRFISGLESPECAKSIHSGYWHVSYVAETRSAPNSRGERSLCVQGAVEHHLRIESLCPRTFGPVPIFLNTISEEQYQLREVAHVLCSLSLTFERMLSNLLKSNSL